ncbi:MAG: NlpC/P60 family protein [Coriobacteriia bacterium]|nr:NlpC/P60 family protein [Coriobacteriia bacterium]
MSTRKRLVAAALACVILIAATPASATPINDKREQAKRVKAQVDVFDQKLEIATEDYNVAAERYGDLSAKVAAVKARLAKIGKKTSVLQTSLNTRASSMYRSGPLGVLDVLFGAATFEDFATTWDVLNDLNKQDARGVAELKSLQSQEVEAKQQLDTARGEARKVFDTMKSRKRFVEGELRKRSAMLRGLESEIAALEAADRARRAAAAREHGGGGGGGGWDYGDPVRAPRSGVVQIAMKYLGARYVWAAAGPRTFDCSGFTMFVYAQVGVRLPHSSRAQINCGERVSRANLKPGDLVFFGSPIHHVGMYIGGGQMIHSPHTGDVVSIDSIDRGNYSGACRP